MPWAKAVHCSGRLESDIALLEQHLETMRATYQLNAEKLEYNYRVLLERDAGAVLETVCWNAVWLAYCTCNACSPGKSCTCDHATYKLWTLAQCAQVVPWCTVATCFTGVH